MDFPAYVKDTLLEIIKTISLDPRPYCFNPEKDFTRKRKLSFSEVIKLIITMEGASIKKELLSYFNFNPETASSSAFIQQRSKIKVGAFEEVFHRFNEKFECNKFYKGYRLIACDGSNLISTPNPNDKDHHYNFKKNNRKFNMTHINTLYDLLSRKYVDAIIEPGYKPDERGALVRMLDRFESKTPPIIIGDRGYASTNFYAYAQENNINYIIRTKKDIAKNLIKSQGLDFDSDFDVVLNLILTPSQKKEFTSQPKTYKYVGKKYFDYYDENWLYPISYRLIRIALDNGSYEYLITNLDKEEFDIKSLKELYNLRWGIETSFKQLKYAAGLVNLHSRKAEHIEQEIFSKLILYNFSEVIISNVVIKTKKRKLVYQINFTLAIYICRWFLRFGGDKSPPDVETLILKEIVPIRENRKFPRKKHNISPVYFAYRVS